MSKIITLDEGNFGEMVGGEQPTLVDFNAEWCGPCQMQAPILEEIAEEGKYKIAEVNVDEQPGLAAEYGVASIPCMVIFKGGKEVKRLVGLRPKKAIVKVLAKYQEGE